MKRAAAAIAAAALAAFVFSSCADMRLIRNDVNSLRADSYQTKKDVSELKATLSYMDKDLNRMKQERGIATDDEIEALKESQSNILNRLTEFEEEVQSLRGKVDEGGYGASQALKKESSDRQALADRVSKMEMDLTAIRESISALEKSMATLVGGGAGASAISNKVAEDAQRQYDAAYEAFKQNQYAFARNKFGAFVTAYPQHLLAGNAKFWIAETYFAEKNYAKAIVEYDDVVTKFKSSPKVSSALLKQAMAFVELGEKRAAIARLRELVEKFPKSEQSEPGRTLLKKLEDETKAPAK